MSPSSYDPWKSREDFIPLPGGKNSSDGYARVLFVGTTGAGKTTIVRQLLGTDPECERFPSISAAKTTICDIEIVLDNGHFKAVVTFIPRECIRQYIAECVLSSVITKYEGAPKPDVFRRFLEHSEQRFRLSYILGNPILLEKSETEELEDDDSEATSKYEQEINETERKRRLDSLNKYFDSISRLTDEYKLIMKNTAHELDIVLEKASPEDQVTIQEIVDDHVTMMDEFHRLVDEIIDDVESRFDLLSKGEIARGRDGWPIQWTYEDKNSDRSEFIRLVNKFSSNYAPNFG
ncbi:MAG: hypothetical protein AB1656_12425 [Candidatus Omnitrophota bacterium]